jgi:hypothetical protein
MGFALTVTSNLKTASIDASTTQFQGEIRNSSGGVPNSVEK